jgi:hypothetical protein
MGNFSAITRTEQATFNEYEVRFVLDQHAQLGLQPPMQSVPFGFYKLHWDLGVVLFFSELLLENPIGLLTLSQHLSEIRTPNVSGD